MKIAKPVHLIKNISSGNLIRKLLLLIFTAIFLFSLFKLVSKLYAYQKEDKLYTDLRASIQHPAAVRGSTDTSGEAAKPMGDSEPSQVLNPAGGTAPAPPLPYTVLRGDPNELSATGVFKVYSELKAQNEDLAGWISIPGFSRVIDYPVMQSGDNDYYLTHDFYKNKSYSGSIFMDSTNKNKEPDRNIVIYGHAMQDMSMFGNLVHYPEDEALYGKNTAIYLDLLDTHLEYQVFSAYSTEAGFNYRRTTFANDSDFLSFLDTIKGKSEHDFGISLSPQDKILTLSTCDRGYGNDGRTVIHAKLVRQIVYGDTSIEGEYVKAVGESDKKIISSNVYLESLSLKYQVAKADESKSDDSKSNAAPTPKPNGKKEVKSPAAKWKNAVLDPPFPTKSLVFSTKIPAGADIAKLTVTTDDPKASLSYTLNGKPADINNLALVEGDNVINVRVMSIDGIYARTYTIQVLREPSPETSQPGQLPSSETKPAASDPKVSDPQISDPQVSESKVSDPKVSDPATSEPTAENQP